MQYQVEVNGRLRQVHVHRHGGQFAVSVDGREWMVDASRIDGHMLSLLFNAQAAETSTPPIGASHEVTLTADAASGQFTVITRSTPVTVALNRRRRWRQRDESGLAGSGPQPVVAPMPGKVLRVLVSIGDRVRARQPLVVVEAMKMENELRAALDGVVAEILVREGQSVEAGGALLVVRPA